MLPTNGSVRANRSLSRLKLLTLAAVMAAAAALILALPLPALTEQAAPNTAVAPSSAGLPDSPPAPDARPSSDATLDDVGTLEIPVAISVTYQAHGPQGTARWTLPVETTIYTAGTGLVITSWVQTTDGNGSYARVVAFYTSTTHVDIRVKHSHTLSNKKYTIPVLGPAMYISMGTLLEGDADNNDQVSILDFSILRTTYGQTCPPCDARADFNEDKLISILDFSLLAMNYAKSGPITVLGARPGAQQASLSALARPDDVLLKLVPGTIVVRPGAIVPVDVVMEAGAQPVDGADIYLDFDPRYLVIVDELGNPAQAIAPGAAFPDLLQNSVDNDLGQINFSAGVLSGEPPTGSLAVARFYVSQRRSPYNGWTTISFSQQRPRQTEVAFAGETILGGTTGGYVNAPSLRLWLPWVTRDLPIPLPIVTQ